MGEATIVDHFILLLKAVAIFALPPLVVAIVVGLVVSVLQSATQIQDQTLPLTLKLVAVAVTLALYGAVLAAPLIQFSDQIFTDFPALTR